MEKAKQWTDLPFVDQFEGLSAKFSTALNKIMPQEERRRTELFEKQMIKTLGRMLCGRHIWWHCLDSMQLESVDESTADMIDLTKLELVGENLGEISM